MLQDIFTGYEAIANRVGKILGMSTHGNSLTSLTAPARVEPITLVDKDIITDPMLPVVTQSVLNIFTAYYLQAAPLMGKIEDVTPREMLSSLNPTDDSLFGISFEDYKYSIESDVTSTTINAADNKELAKDLTRELTNLSVGRIFNITLGVGQEKTTIPITVRLLVNSISSDKLITMLKVYDALTIKERWRGWKTGRLAAIKDLLFCNDLIDNYKKKLATVNSTEAGKIISGGWKRAITRIVSDKIYLSSVSNIVIISEDTVKQLESEMGAKVSKYETRQKMFAETGIMIFVVISKAWETATFYQKGVTHGNELTLKDMQASNKSGGVDTNEILKSLLTGSTPRF